MLLSLGGDITGLDPVVWCVQISAGVVWCRGEIVLKIVRKRAEWWLVRKPR